MSFILFSLYLIISVHCAHGSWEIPSFCQDIECPIYEVIEKTETYELRKYLSAKWVSTVVKDVSYIQAESIGFLRLYDYITGKNEGSLSIEMTAPVKTLIIPGDGPTCEQEFVISFYIPYEYQMNPPAPTSEDVYIENAPETYFYVSVFGGYALEYILIEEASLLIKNLEEDGKKFDVDTYYVSQYNSPFQLTNRHNEIWIFKSDPKSL